MKGFDDIVFSKRFKNYGAYLLRKRYKWHLLWAMMITFVLSIGFILFFMYRVFVTNNISYQILNDSTGIYDFTNFDLAEVPAEPQKKPEVSENDNSSTEVAKVSSSDLGLNELETEELIKKMTNNENTIESISDDIEKNIDALNKNSDLDAIASINSPILEKETELRRYIYQNTKYPDSALNNKLNGLVMVQFILTSKGEINNLTIIKNAHSILDREALRVVRTLPTSKPVLIKGKPVPVMFKIPIVFKI